MIELSFTDVNQDSMSWLEVFGWSFENHIHKKVNYISVYMHAYCHATM